jgi:hypothetical protein
LCRVDALHLGGNNRILHNYNTEGRWQEYPEKVRLTTHFLDVPGVLESLPGIVTPPSGSSGSGLERPSKACLMIGGTGLIGRGRVRKLLDEGHSVWVLAVVQEQQPSYSD